MPLLAQQVHTTRDSFGAVVAEYTFFPRPQVLYVRWQGHVTSDELVRAAYTGLEINQQWQPRGLFHDLRASSGEWGEAGPWLEHEWVPGIHAQCPQLRRLAVLLDSAVSLPYTNTQVLTQLDRHFDFQVFYSLLAAWRWINRCTGSHPENQRADPGITGSSVPSNAN
ncbi:hypothetical protein F0P96_10320 [Hymenobacter busanensis]|uniref:Uncharacterized protein n=1 Tax=Hymenobacter busanensis TaxID=2607656 RepID=A0A7L4ZYQ2_9BACT|nr:hypothetical protein [Hymenobacter busanensis]KAA9333355.1 hypothetical protein F0P96_10320 [Hymenobacter busanensis]QHJ07966.1 hypothetical protein GUY19_11990 [Hymenobacter busanensis]